MDDIGKQFKAFTDKVKKTLDDIPLLAANEAVNFFQDSFRHQAWSGDHQEVWPKRKNNVDPGRALLVKRARLKRSIRTKKASWTVVIVGTDVPYAGVNNDGFKGTEHVRAHRRRIKKRDVKGTGSSWHRSKKIATGVGFVKAHTRKMNIPRRRFIGNSPFLNARIERVIMNRLKKL